MPIVDIEQAAPTPGRGNSCLTTVVSAKLTSERELRVAIEAAFLPVPIARGLIVLYECHVGTTGARFEARAEQAMLENLTVPDDLTASHTIAKTTERLTQYEPSVKAKNGSTEFEFSVGSDTQQQSRTSSTTFSGNECRLAVVQSAGSFVRWHLRRDRAEKDVADYVEGDLDLKAKVTCLEAPERVVTVTAQPTDIRFFGSNGEVLSRTSSVGLWLRLRSKGSPVPSRKATRHVIRIIDDSAGDAWAHAPLR